MSPYSITREHAVADAMAVQEAINLFAAQEKADGAVIERLREIRDSIEEQAIEEPELFGSVVRAGLDGISDRVLWIRSSSSYWFSETSRRADWSDLYHPEVLRIGVGAEYNHSLQQLRDILFRSPSGEMTNREGAEAYKALRREIGILLSEPPASEQYGADPYKTGYQDAIDRLQKHLIQLRSSAITAERQDAFDKAIKAVEALS